MLKKLNKESEEFPLPRSCDRSIRIGREWHTCNNPKGHEGNHACKHFEWDDKEDQYDAPTDRATKIAADK